MASRTRGGLLSVVLFVGVATMRPTARLRTRSGDTNSSGATPVIFCPPDRIYNIDETGLLYWFSPSRSYVPRRDC